MLAAPTEVVKTPPDRALDCIRLTVATEEHLMWSQEGGLGAVSFGISEIVVWIVLIAAVAFGVWKVAKLLWAAFSG